MIRDNDYNYESFTLALLIVQHEVGCHPSSSVCLVVHD